MASTLSEAQIQRNARARRLIENPFQRTQAQIALLAILVTDPRAPGIIAAIRNAVSNAVHTTRSER